jgi:cholesterol oxidase
MTGAAPAPGAARLSFMEEVHGFISAGETDFDRGLRRGEAEGTWLRLDLHIEVADVFDFVSRLGGMASATGSVSSSLFGDRLAVEQGWFQLFVIDGVPRLKHERYRLFFADADGSPLTLSGFKTIHDHPGLDVWREATTLYTRILSGHVDAGDEPEAATVAAGIVHVDLLDVIRQLSTIQVEAPDEVTKLEALYRFGAFFLGNLWSTHGPGAPGRERG